MEIFIASKHYRYHVFIAKFKLACFDPEFSCSTYSSDNYIASITYR